MTVPGTTLGRWALLAAASLAALVMPSACGSSSSSSSTSSQGAAKFASEVPAAVRSRGTLVVASDASYAPNESIGPDGKTVIGMDADLAAAIAQELGLQVTVENVTFDDIIPGLAAGKYSLGMSSFTDSKEREKTVDFVTYFRAGTSFLIKASGGPSINTLDDLCGHRVAVEKGTTEQDDATGQDKKCKDAGRSAIDIQVYPDQNGTNLALQNGRADVVLLDSPVADYQIQQAGGQFKESGSAYGFAPYGIAIPKGSGMAKPVLDAVKDLIGNGTYMTILRKYGIQAGAINNPVINGAVS